MNATHAWFDLLARFAPVFTAPSFGLFVEMATAWVLCPGRRTITRMIPLSDPNHSCGAHDAFHRFFRDGVWCLNRLWKTLAILLVNFFYPDGAIPLDIDDTVFHKSGRKVDGSAWWRDAVRSTGQKTVHCFGLNLVVITLRIHPPWGGEPLGLPVNMRLHRKGEEGLLELAREMLLEMSDWWPQRTLAVCADGFYAPLLKNLPPSCRLTSRMRRDAALYAPPPKNRKRGKGRPRKKGHRLPTPQAIPQANRKWQCVQVDIRGKTMIRLVATRDVLWYQCCKDRIIRLVICRDPDGVEPDDFFFTTDLQAAAATVIEQYAGRWSIEDTFKGVKQSLAGHTPQSWKRKGPERTAALALSLYSTVWFWFISVKQFKSPGIRPPWCPNKINPSFGDALAALRTHLWRARIFPMSEKDPVLTKNIEKLISVLAFAS